MYFAAVAGLDHELAVGAQEVRGHADLAAIRRHRPLLFAELLDEGEDVVPAAAIEAGLLVLQLPQDLVHLEGGEVRLDQHGGLDRLLRHAERILRGDEHVVPEPRLGMALHLRQVEYGARCRATALPWCCGRRRGRNRTASPTSACRRPSRASREGASCAARTNSAGGRVVQLVDLPLLGSR